jgi:hypothetical protein
LLTAGTTEIKRCEAELEALQAEAALLQSAMDKGEVAIVEEMLQQRDVNEMKRVQGLAAAFEAGGDKREQLLQQVRSLGFFSRAFFVNP